ncbi:hypothetical protein [Enterovibrio calviensis]|uniref:hypothetical protein n=1 Tax=Enterovibrio calviensis TaxID=91359 RepID=UPI00373541D3
MRLISNALFAGLMVISICAYSAPDWFSSTEVDPKWVTGVGVGEDLESAQQQALKNLSLSLYSEVSSYTEQTVVTEGNKGKVHSQAVTKVENKHVPLSIVHWLKQAYVDELYYVRGGVIIAEWVIIQETKLEGQIAEIESITSLSEWSLGDYRRSKAIALKDNQAIAAMISPYSMMSSRYSAASANLAKKQNQFANAVCFTVEQSHDKVADKYFLPVIKNALYYSHLTVSERAECRKVQFVARNDRVSDKHIQTTLLISVDGELPYQVDVKGSGSSYKSALVSVANNLSDYFVEQGGILPK